MVAFLCPPPFMTGSVPWSVTYIGGTTHSPGSASVDFGNWNILHDGLVVACVAGLGGSNATVSGVTIGGSGAFLTANPSGNTKPVNVSYGVRSAGLINISAVFSSSQQRAGIAVYLIRGYQSSVHYDTDGVQQTSSTSQTRTVSIPAGGVAIYCHIRAGTSNTSSTWSSANKVIDDFESTMNFSSAFLEPETPVTHSETVSWSGSFSRSLAVASFY